MFAGIRNPSKIFASTPLASSRRLTNWTPGRGHNAVEDLASSRRSVSFLSRAFLYFFSRFSQLTERLEEAIEDLDLAVCISLLFSQHRVSKKNGYEDLACRLDSKSFSKSSRTGGKLRESAKNKQQGEEVGGKESRFLPSRLEKERKRLLRRLLQIPYKFLARLNAVSKTKL